MWVAKCKLIDGTLIDKELSPRFNSILECQDFIDKKLVILEYLLSEVQSFIDSYVDNKFNLRFGHFIRCYNLEQERFCDGFDF